MHGRQSYSSYEQALDLLGEASHVVVELANSVGIDGDALLNNLPASGTLLTGAQVPVIHPGYRHTCWVLFYINTTHNVGWPFIRFYTFRHGGVSVDFNGWQWRKAGLIPNLPHNQTSRPAFAASDHYQTTGDDDYRLERFNQLVDTFNDSPRLDALHPWVVSRLGGHADSGVTERVEVAATADGRIIAPFHSEKNGHTGFHVINTGSSINNKRHYVRRIGLKQGSYIGIAALNDSEMLPTGVCEGLATGLSIALVWPGQIRVALDAGNLVAVRQDINGPVTLFADNDQWSSTGINTGMTKARQAATLIDKVIIPAFSAASLSHKPTDFNDLLQLEGLNALKKSLRY